MPRWRLFFAVGMESSPYGFVAEYDTAAVVLFSCVFAASVQEHIIITLITSAVLFQTSGRHGRSRTSVPEGSVYPGKEQNGFSRTSRCRVGRSRRPAPQAGTPSPPLSYGGTPHRFCD